MDKVGETRQASVGVATSLARAFDDKSNIGRDVSEQLVWRWRVLSGSSMVARQLDWDNGGHNVMLQGKKKNKNTIRQSGIRKWPHLDK